MLGGGGLKDHTSLPFFGSPPFFVILSLCHDAFLSTSLDTLRFLSLSSGEGFCLNIDIFVDQFFSLKSQMTIKKAKSMPGLVFTKMHP